MIARKLRLQHGWSQDQLAEFSGLSVRTIQRIERGHKASLESSKALASVFEVDISTFLLEDTTMQTLETKPSETHKAEIQEDEREALAYAKRVSEQIQGIIVYVIITAIALFKWGLEPKLLLILGAMAVFYAIYSLFVFEVIRLPFHDFERRVAEKRLGRKL